MRFTGADRWRFVRMGVSKPNYDAPIPDRWYRRGDGGLLLPWDGLGEGRGVAPAANDPNAARRARRTARGGEVTYVIEASGGPYRVDFEPALGALLFLPEQAPPC